MFGHAAGRQRRSLWAILSFLFALAFAWSFAVMGERSGGLWIILRVGLAVGLGISLLRLVLTFVSSRRLRRAQESDEWRAEADEGAEPAEEPSTDKHALTYQEVFQVQPNIDLGSLPRAPEDEEWKAEADEGAEIEAEGQRPAEEPPVEERAPTEAVEADVESQEALRRMREEFKTRAEEAELRVKQREAELEEAPSAPKSKP